MPILASVCTTPNCGSVPLTANDCLVDETGILVDEFTLTPTREIVRHTNAQGCVAGVQLKNPELEIGIQGAPLNTTDFLNSSQPGEPLYNSGGAPTGQAFLNITNFGGTPFGHDVTIGCVLLTDVQFTCSSDADAAQIQLTAIHFQHAV